jgi:hypothetical protein
MSNGGRFASGLGFKQRLQIQTKQVNKTKNFLCKQCCGSGSVFFLVNLGQNDPQKVKKFKFLSARYFLLRDEDFSCSLDVLYGGLGISKLPFFIQKILILSQL